MTIPRISQKAHMLHRKVTAVVHSGINSKQAGVQILVDGEILEGHILPYPNKKKPLRICVLGTGGRSSVWNVWANRSASDVYIAIRSSASLHKISLHESGDFRYQLIGTTKAELARPDLAFMTADGNDTDEGRILHRWRRPEQNPAGWISCVSLVIPASELQAHDIDKPENITWLPAPPRGYATEIQGFLVQPGIGEFDLTDATAKLGTVSVVGGLKLPNGQVFVMLSANIRMMDQDHRMLRDARRKSRRGAHRNFDWAPKNGPRMLVVATASGERPAFVDARV